MVTLAQEPCGRGQLAVALGEAEISVLLAQVPAWRREGGRLVRDFAFADYHHTMAFVNAVAGVAHEADHHPVLLVRFGSCRVEFSTHDCDGLSRKDFICAARVDQIHVMGECVPRGDLSR